MPINWNDGSEDYNQIAKLQARVEELEQNLRACYESRRIEREALEREVARLKDIDSAGISGLDDVLRFLVGLEGTPVDLHACLDAQEKVIYAQKALRHLLAEDEARMKGAEK